MEYKSLGDYFYYTDSLSHGSFSIIYRGYRISDRKPVAIKKITRYISKDYIDSEINLMSNLNNENILKLYEVIKENNSIYLILELCNRGDLSMYIKTNIKDNDLYYSFQIIKGLEYLHNNNILHRDIKPQNILLHNDIIKICDFGFSKKIKDNDLISTFCGSPLYMAPEILKYNEYTDKADIWSLGVILYELIYKNHPYPCKNKKSLVDYLNKEVDIQFPYIIDYEFNNLLKLMLNKDPNTRITWEEIFNNIWILQYRGDGGDSSTCDLNNSFDLDSIFECESKININFTEIENKHIASSAFTNIKNINTRLSSSTLTIKECNVRSENHEDYKIYSKSAPVTNNYYLENYITKESKKQNSNGYHILGNSEIKESGTYYNYLEKSVNTLKNLFSIK